eukprot:TRINITY_DN16318_c0_g1_i1.p1 TRINITY_DN16318_c0_g1~~TRINITY_DN16318_c0_g1_i1.p1  ORF type:complete len:396 (+),score=79.15 TRINITY_DN16318_c0_g1_i1:112-1299(+)
MKFSFQPPVLIALVVGIIVGFLSARYASSLKSTQLIEPTISSSNVFKPNPFVIVDRENSTLKPKPWAKNEAAENGLAFIPSSLCPTPPPKGKFRNSSFGPQDPGRFFETFRDAAKCYCMAWRYFALHQPDYVGEDGSNGFKNSLLEVSDLYRKTSPLVDSDKIVIDVGANIGQNAPFLSTFSPPNTDFYFFEPNPVNWRLLNTTLATYPRANFVPKAVSDQVGTMMFTLPYNENPDGNQAGHLSFVDDGKGDKRIPVDSITLDSFFNKPQFQNKDFYLLKIDTEGFDVVVLRGAPWLLSRVRIILFECHVMMRTDPHAGPGTTHNEAQELLASFGFETFKLGADQWIPFTGVFYHPAVDLLEYMGWHNCAAIRRTDPLLPYLYNSHVLFEDCESI